MHALIAMAACVFVCFGVMNNATAAQASAEHKTGFDIDFEGSALTLDGGFEHANPYTQIDSFQAEVHGNGPALRWRFDGRNPEVVKLAKVTAYWRIVEHGVPTHLWVYTDQGPLGHACAIFHDRGESAQDVALAQGRALYELTDDTSPYSCQMGVDWQTGLVLRLAPVVWSSVAGSLTAEGFVGLDQGHQTSPNDHFLVSDSLHKPTDPVANINPGETTSWNADIRNGEGATADDGARTDFTYRILDDGEPTQYYAKGFMQNVKADIHFNQDYGCQIYDGDPLFGGAATEGSPYTCEGVAPTSGWFNSHLAVDFKVRVR